MNLCHVQQKAPVKLQAAQTPLPEKSIALSIQPWRLKIVRSATKTAARRIRAVTIASIDNGARSFSNEIRSVRLPSCVAVSLAQRKPITSFRFAPAAHVLICPTGKELARKITRERRR